MEGLEIRYLYNSGFLVKLKSCTLILDYYMDQSANRRYTLNGGVLSMEDLCKFKNPYVLISHSHKDHYNPIVLKWKAHCPDMHYIISSDVRTSQDVDARLSAGETYEDSLVKVKAYGSTDEGVSFTIEACGYKIFFAGDFNFWHWKQESTEQEVKQASARFLSVIKTLKEEAFDVVFFPVDPRMGKQYDAGALYFAKTFQPKLFIPMHFREDTQICKTFADKLLTRCPDTQVWNIRQRGQRLLWKEGHIEEGETHV